MTDVVLTPEHTTHLRSEGFSEQQIDQMMALGVRSLTIEEAQLLGFWAKDDKRGKVSSSGLYFPFSKDFGQLRCDDPPIREGKLAKYLSPVGLRAEAYLPDGAKWITEGWKDAYAGTAHGEISVGAIAGVSHYRKALPKNSGLGVIFDADGWRNPSVFYNLVRAAQWTGGKIQLVPEIPGEPKGGLCEWFKSGATAEDFEALLASAMTAEDFLLELPKHWVGTSFKQFDACLKTIAKLGCEILDQTQREKLITELKAIAKKEHGLPVGAIKSAFARRLAIRQRERQKQSRASGKLPPDFDNRGNAVLPAGSEVADFIRVKHGSTLAWNVTAQAFYQYGKACDGYWSELSPEATHSLIAKELESLTDWDLGYEFNYLQSCFRLLQVAVQRSQWNQSEGSLLPFRNGVLRVATGELLPHSPEHGFTWQLPYNYDPAASCEPIQEWIKWSQGGDADRVQLLRAWLKAVVMGRYDLQRFLEMVGPGGTGKSTFTTLAIALVGLENCHSTTLTRLETNRFETANVQGKRLLLITDSDRYGGDVAMLKRATGGDLLPAERKGIQVTPTFMFSGIVMMSANEPIRSTDLSSGLERRRCQVPFSKQVAPEDRRNLISVTASGATGEFVPFLPGLLNWAIAMPDAEMERLIRQTERYVPALAVAKAEAICETNSIAAWLDDCCYWAPGVQTQIGTSDRSRQDHWLYASYHAYCSDRGMAPVGIARFTPSLEDLCQNQLKRPDVKRGRSRDHRYFEGIAIRDKFSSAARPITEPPPTQPAPAAEQPPPLTQPERTAEQPVPTPLAKPLEPKRLAVGGEALILKQDGDGWLRADTYCTIQELAGDLAKVITTAGNTRTVPLEKLQPA